MVLGLMRKITQMQCIEIHKYVTSALMSSYAWDTTLNFICQNSKEGYMLATTTDNRYGNIEFKGSGSPKAAGQDENDNYCNIHDILGNYSEWTTERPESGNGDWVSRGGNYLRKESTYTSGHDAYAADRSSSFSSGIYEGIGSRVEIYINDTV